MDCLKRRNNDSSFVSSKKVVEPCFSVSLFLSELLAHAIRGIALCHSPAARSGNQLLAERQVVVPLHASQTASLIQDYPWRAEMIGNQPLDFLTTAEVPKAWISTTRLHESGTVLIVTRILLVVTGEKVNLRQTLLFPVTLPPGIVVQVTGSVTYSGIMSSK